MLLFEIIAEQKIREAIERGELDNLPGAGRPLDLYEDPLVPEELRMSYRILKNAGLMPPEVDLRSEIHQLERLIDRLSVCDERTHALRKLELLNIKLSESRRGGQRMRAHGRYYQKLIDKLG